MQTILVFLTGVVLSILFSFAVIIAIRKSYRGIVEELCGTPERAGYWIRVSELCLIVVTVFAAITFHDYRGLSQFNNVTLFWSLVGQMAWVLATVFLSLIIISLIVLVSLPQQGKRIELPNGGLPRNQ